MNHLQTEALLSQDMSEREHVRRAGARTIIGVGPGRYVPPHDPPSGTQRAVPAEPSVILVDFVIDESQLRAHVVAANERAWRRYYRETMRRSVRSPIRWLLDWMTLRN